MTQKLDSEVGAAEGDSAGARFGVDGHLRRTGVPYLVVVR